MMMKNGKRVVNIMNYHNKNQVQIPTFDLIKLGQNHRVPILNRFVHGQPDNNFQGELTMTKYESLTGKGFLS